MPDRRSYAARQAELLDSLLRGDGHPPGFGAAQVDAAGGAVRAKRARAVRHAWPALAVSLGPEFAGRFDGYARAAGAPARPGPLADGLAFVAWLGDDPSAATDDVLVEALLARAQGARRGLFLGGRRLRGSRRALIVVGLPGLGRRHLSVALGRRTE